MATSTSPATANPVAPGSHAAALFGVLAFVVPYALFEASLALRVEAVQKALLIAAPCSSALLCWRAFRSARVARRARSVDPALGGRGATVAGVVLAVLASIGTLVVAYLVVIVLALWGSGMH